MADIQEKGMRFSREHVDVSSHQKVYGVFKSLIEHPNRGHLDSKGKTYYHHGDRVGFDNAPDTYEVSESHKRKTSFTEEQEKYMDLCRVNLRDSIISADTGLLARFKKRWDNGGNIKKFEDFLVDSYMESINDAFNKNPNLLPAFYGFLVSSGAGSQGLELALEEGLYPGRVTSRSLPDNYKAFVGVDGTDIHIGGHGKVESEVQCAAPALAMKIIDEVQKCILYAGLEIGDIENTRFHGPTPEISTKIEDMLAEKMKTLGYKPPKI